MIDLIIQLLRLVIGLPLALFIPGYLITLIFFDELEKLEKIALGFVLSICVDISLGLFLGYNKTMKDLTGGITALNLWIYLSVITLILFIIYLLKKKGKLKSVFKRFRKEHF